jgi:hypothetical protein
MKKILWTLLLIFSVSLPANSQPALTPMVGKAFADNKGASAIRMGMGLNNVYRDRWGVYYTYEYRSNIMFFENTAYGKNEYRRDVVGISCKVHPNFMVYGGVGLFMDGILKGQLQSKGGGTPFIIKPVGLRKEIGVTYYPKDLPIQLSAGYSLSVGFTGNLGWSIPFEADLITVHQALLQNME